MEVFASIATRSAESPGAKKEKLILAKGTHVLDIISF